MQQISSTKTWNNKIGIYPFWAKVRREDWYHVHVCQLNINLQPGDSLLSLAQRRQTGGNSLPGSVRNKVCLPALINTLYPICLIYVKKKLKGKKDKLTLTLTFHQQTWEWRQSSHLTLCQRANKLLFYGPCHLSLYCAFVLPTRSPNKFAINRTTKN